MTINYTSLLGLAQPVTGTESGTWGTVVNDEITALVEQAVAGGVSIDVTAGNVTLTSTSGASNQARNAVLLVTGTPGVSRNIVAPSSSKVYLVKNGSDGAVVLKGSSTTGVTIPVGVEALCFWNGSDFEIAGVTGPSSSTDNAFVRFDSTTGKVIQNSTGATLSDTGEASFTGYVSVAGTSASGSYLELYEDTDNGTNYIRLQAPATIASNVSFTLPNADGTNGQVLQTNGSGVLSFTTPSSGISTGKSIAMAMIFGF
jgi:hypothetical protein